jgi:hypothetical protein
MYERKSTVYVKYIMLVVFIPLLIASCSLTNEGSEPTARVVINPSMKDTSWLTGVPCKLPCWYGITVGISTKEEVLSSIQSLSFIDFSSSVENESQYWDPRTGIVEPSQLMSIPCMQPIDHICTQMFFVDNVLMEIILIPNFQISFGEVVKEIGEPDYLTARPVYPEVENCYVRLIWVDRQMMISNFYYGNKHDIDLCEYISDNDYRPPKDLLVESVWIEIQEFYNEIPIPGEDFIWGGFLDD